MTGFLEEAPGVKSITRLTIAQLVVALVVLVIAAAYVAVWGVRTASSVAAPIVTALGVVILGLAGGIVGAVSQRNKGVGDAAQ